MSRKASLHPTDAELEILTILWRIGPAPLGAIFDALNASRPVARTTVATMLGVMLEKNLVRRAESPAGYAWSAAVTRASAARGMMWKVIDGLYEGSAGRMVAHLVEDGELDAEQLRQLEEFIQSKKDKKGDTK